MPGTRFSEDKDSYADPLERYTAELEQAFLVASQQVRGSQARLQKVIDEDDALQEYHRRVADHLRNANFQTLPGVKHQSQRVPDVRRLSVGPWQGSFLVSADASNVIGLVFSKAPHDYEGRLNELVLKNRRGGGP